MAIEINGKVYRNIQEQVAENQDNIAELQRLIEDSGLSDLKMISIDPNDSYDHVSSLIGQGYELIYFKYNNRTYISTEIEQNQTIVFTCVNVVGTTVRQYYRKLDTDGTWTQSYYNIEKTSNKTSSINNASTDAQYPSAKATYTFGTNLLTPSQATTNVISGGEAIFTFANNVFDSANNKWLAIFTMGNTFTMFPLYGLSQNTMYKCPGSFVYDSGGSVVTTTLNYEILSNKKVQIWSGNSNYTLQNGYTAYLSLIRLF